jgi:uncharacterized membrane protein YfcA
MTDRGFAYSEAPRRLCKPCEAVGSAMQHNAGLKARALIYVTTVQSPMNSYAPVITDPMFYVLAIPAVTLLGLGKGGFAGIGMISTPLLALVMPPLQGAAILLPILIIQDAISLWTYRRAWSAWNLKVLMPGSLLGIGVAGLFASYVSNAVIELSVGAIGLCFVLYMWLGASLRRTPAKTQRPHAAMGILWGSLAGVMSTLIQVGSPPFQIHILPQRLDKLTLVGTSVIFFAFMNWVKVVPYLALGQFSTRNFATSVALLPLAVVANFFGIWLVRITPTERFYRIAYILMLLISLVLLWQGESGLRG